MPLPSKLPMSVSSPPPINSCRSSKLNSSIGKSKGKESSRGFFRTKSTPTPPTEEVDAPHLLNDENLAKYLQNEEFLRELQKDEEFMSTFLNGSSACALVLL